MGEGVAKEKRKVSHVSLLEEHRLESSEWFNYLRMDERTFLELLHMVTL